ncbi:Uncharacterized protein TPAR_07827 [Tolypocladium paradoxum]|uniref:Heat shock 70 kDa protein 12B n=1 Tax=Tolypocladium paradoxum TaxID=94208 RepID=A0A2S4KP56_9HYPO|nr:Uncharacterized protein TPAR_07827 [Tolypocladium paradoxum]
MEDSLVIGIDFGTTYSGVAWAYSRHPEIIQTVANWEAEFRHCSDMDRTPTALCYGSVNEATTWGYAVPADKVVARWFKLLLLDDKDVPENVLKSPQFLEARAFQSSTQKDPTEIIACFLKYLWNHSIDSIKREIEPELLEKCIFHVVITLPAIWPHYAQNRMRIAAEISGMLAERSCGETTLRFVSEPEAAALATITDLSKRSTIKASNIFAKGDTMVVCDAGGGTVDLISYLVERIEPFQIKECVKGEGGLCGGVFVDAEFLKMVETKLGSVAWGGLSKAEKQKLLNDSWEHNIKSQFHGQDRSWFVELPDTCQTPGGQKRRRSLEFSSQEMASVFMPVTKKIEDLLQRQLTAIAAKHQEDPKVFRPSMRLHSQVD